jgi:sugar transferase (PEP-CTERM/EpsH1 system associated)
VIEKQMHTLGPAAGATRPAVLYLVHRTPYPLDKGERIRAFHVLKYLGQHCDVSLACLADEAVSAEGMQVLSRYCQRLAVAPIGSLGRWLGVLRSAARGRSLSEGAFRSQALWNQVRDWARDTPFQAVIASASSMAPYLAIPELRSARKVVDLVDVDSQKWLDYAAHSRIPATWLYAVEGRRLRRLECSLASWVHGVTLVTEAEVELFRQFSAAGNVQVVRQGVDLDYFQPDATPEEPICVFTGVLNYKPNVEGILWFCQEVWPQIHERRPQARLLLVGRRPAPAIQALSRLPGVEVVGPVPDIRPYLARAAAAIVPLKIARGVQNKALEAMAMCKAVVVSPPVLTGLRAVPGLHVLQAATQQEWLDALVQLLDQPERRRELGLAGRRFVEENHRWEECLQPFGALLGLPAEESHGHRNPVEAEGGPCSLQRSEG